MITAIRMKTIFLLSIVLSLGCVGDSEATDSVVSKKFEMFHDINWPNEPNNLRLKHMPEFNLEPNSSVYWTGDLNVDDPSESATKSYVMSFPYGEQRYIDIEHLPYRYDRTTAQEQLETVRKLSMVLHWAKTQRPDIQIGIFSMTVENIFLPLASVPQAYIDRNERFKPLAEYADVIYLDLYTWFADRHSVWSDALNTSVNQARKTNKKIIAFLWPHYQSPASGNALMSGTEWRMQLEEAYLLVDGIVIWDKKTCDWTTCASDTDSNNWYYQTLDFMQAKGL